MNNLIIAVQVNDKRWLLGASWPKTAILLNRMKQKVEQLLLDAAMILTPMPQVVAA